MGARVEELSRRLAEMPEGWRSEDVSIELLASCLEPSAESVGVLPDGLRWQSVDLACRPATAKSTADGRAFVVPHYPEFFVRIGWTPVPGLRTVYYMVPPEGAGQPPSTRILVPVPDMEAMTAWALERQAAGVPWQGMVWNWPATFAPAAVTREWREKGLRIRNASDDWGATEIPAGWKEVSTPATFEIGLFGVWQVSAAWDPELTMREYVGVPWM